jgi:hypothetical protein
MSRSAILASASRDRMGDPCDHAVHAAAPAAGCLEGQHESDLAAAFDTMSRRRPRPETFMLKLLVVLTVALVSHMAWSQPTTDPEQQEKTVSPYLYMVDSSGNKLLLSTQFWRNDAKYDDRAFHRFLDVMAALEKRGFHKNEKAVIDNWDRPEPVVRCYIYLEDLQAAKKTKGPIVSGSRLWCSDNGASEHEVPHSDNPKHIEEVLKYFDEYFTRAKAKVRK